MIKLKKNLKKTTKKQTFSGFNILVFCSILLICAECVGPEPEPLTGTYSTDETGKKTLTLYDNNSFFFHRTCGLSDGTRS